MQVNEILTHSVHRVVFGSVIYRVYHCGPQLANVV